MKLIHVSIPLLLAVLGVPRTVCSTRTEGADRRRLATGRLPVAPAGGWVNPGKDTFTLRFQALGDFGATLEWQGSQDKGPDGTRKNPMCPQAQQGWGSRVNEKAPFVECNSVEWWRHWWAQSSIAYLMGTSAEGVKPTAVLTQGDNFYWDGVANPRSEVFRAVFEDVYTSPSLMNIDWLITLGNHDIGGTAYICGTDPGTTDMHDSWHKPCNSASEATAAMQAYFEATKNYKSPTGRWIFEGAYFKRTYTDNRGTTVEVYTVDTNVATTHGMQEVCCQCFGYGTDAPFTCAKGNNKAACGFCRNAAPGSDICAPKPIYDACVAVVQSWFDESMQKLAADLASSKADWRIVNTHYCPLRHFTPADAAYQKLMSTISGKVNVVLCGHTHAAAHDYDKPTKTHHVMNGLGGGITAESAAPVSDQMKDAVTLYSSGGIYGFMELSVSKGWMKVDLVTTDNNWGWGPTMTPGGAVSVYCSYIPVDGSEAVPCSKASNWIAPTGSGSLVENVGDGSLQGGNGKAVTVGEQKSGKAAGQSSASSSLTSSCIVLVLATLSWSAFLFHS